MPVMDGYTATQIIRTMPQYKNLPIIAMTANVMAEDIKYAKSSGMNDHIAKPVHFETMFNTLRRWIKPSINSKPATLSTEPQNDIETTELPDSLHIDTELGLERTLTKALYTRLLKRFLETQISFIEECKTAIQKHDQELSIRLAHTLKGTAATLGMTELATAAGKLEKTFENDNIEITPILLSVESKLNVVLNDLRAWQCTNKENAQNQDKTESHIDPTELKNSLQLLQKFIERNDVEALSLAQKLLSSLSDKDANALMAKIVTALKVYDFELAIEHLTKLRNHLEDSEK